VLKHAEEVELEVAVVVAAEAAVGEAEEAGASAARPGLSRAELVASLALSPHAVSGRLWLNAD
jgi:hypothetical protein